MFVTPFRIILYIAAAYTYYRSMKQDDSLKKRGLIQQRNQTRRRRERIIRVRVIQNDVMQNRSLCVALIIVLIYIQKLQERSAVLEKADMPSKDKDKWKKIFRADIMSSEESSLENDDIYVKPIPWRAERIGRFFSDIE